MRTIMCTAVSRYSNFATSFAQPASQCCNAVKAQQLTSLQPQPIACLSFNSRSTWVTQDCADNPLCAPASISSDLHDHYIALLLLHAQSCVVSLAGSGFVVKLGQRERAPGQGHQAQHLCSLLPGLHLCDCLALPALSGLVLQLNELSLQQQQWRQARIGVKPKSREQRAD